MITDASLVPRPSSFMGAGSGGARGGTGPPSFLDWGGGTGGTKKWYQHLHESSKIMLSEVHQILHITLTIPEVFCNA